MLLDPSRRDYKNVEDLMQDRWNYWQHRYYSWIAVFAGFITPTLIAACWRDWLGGLLIVGVLRTAVNHHFTFCINSVCHMFGQRRYSLEQTARDNWITAFFTFGEGFHNFHHQFPLDYRNGIRAFHFDPTKWLIWTLKQLRLAKDLKTISNACLARYRLRAEEQALLTAFKQKSDALMSYIHNYLIPLHTQILQVISRIEAIEKYGKIKEYRDQLKAAHSELKYSLWVWSKLTKTKLLQQII
jgi:stearoyl-CoA desaturase (delta-9 desaturase)